MEKQVKEMLESFEEEGEFSAEKAEVFYQKRPLLITHVKNFYHMYRTLAERYDSVTGELRKYIPSSMQSHGTLGISESDSETQSSSPSPLPDMQEKILQKKARPDFSDVSVGSGVSSDVSKKGSEGSSSSSESDSELEQTKEENGNLLFALSQKVIELEEELHEARGKLETLEEKNMHYKERLQSSDIESNNYQNDLEETASVLESSTEVNNEKEALQAVLIEHKYEIEVLKGAMASASEQFEIELAHRDREIDKCKHELGELSEKYLHDKSTLEAELRKLQGIIKNLEGDLEKMSQEKLQFESQVEELEQAAQNLEYSSSEVVKLQQVIKNTQAELEKVAEEKQVLKERTMEFEQLFRDFEVSGKEVAKLPETIKNLEAQLEKALGEKSTLQDRIKELEQVMCDSLEKHSKEQSTLHADHLKLSEANASLESKLSSFETELMRLYVDKEEESLNSEKHISVLNQDLANIRSKLELLTSEKAAADGNMTNLLVDITTRDEKMKQMDDHLNQVKLEHDKLVSEFGVACKSLSELRARVSELEDEVEKQKLMVSESAEGKREAIRQLCFSMEHYRSGYQELRQLLHGNRRPLVMAT
jgi:chromosome segregation ATPase